jgi:undecaprenyl-diphosphatase
MRLRLPIRVPPTRLDLRIARFFKGCATPATERTYQVLTYAADEKPLLVAAFLYWITARFASERQSKDRADHVLLCTALSAALPHILKLIFVRERPDRRVAILPRHGIPLSGEPQHSFPSGHALHLGALAAALSRSVSTPKSLGLWAMAGLLATSRLLLLAHYLSDVVVGLCAGFAAEKAVAGAEAMCRAPLAHPSRVDEKADRSSRRSKGLRSGR